MKPFSIGKVYLNEQNERTVEINPLPENYCSFDCVFCPLGRTKVKTDQIFDFKETEIFLKNLEDFFTNENIVNVYIYPDGEALAHGRISDIIHLIKKYDIRVKIISNGYLFNRAEYKNVLDNCDEIIGELVVTNEHHFQKLQRPLPGYTLEKYLTNMERFNKHYKGKFVLDITILKDYSDSNEAIEKFKDYIQRINPDEIYVHTPDGEKLKKAFGINEVRLREITNQLNLPFSNQ